MFGKALGVGPWWAKLIYISFMLAFMYVGWWSQRKRFATRQNSLARAVLNSDLPGLKKAIAAGADVNRLENNMTPLQWAISRKDIASVRLLLENGADPNLRASQDESSLWSAEIEFGYREIAELLKSHGATFSERESR